jgi:hypothetical protein
MPKAGCFEASYPSTDWREVPCAPAPSPTRRPTPYTVGGVNTPSGGIDYDASGSILTAVGSFDSVNATSESGISPITGTNAPNTFSLQINTNRFVYSNSTICTQPVQCGNAWQQFIFSTSYSQVFIQYWLNAYGASCPTGWQPDGNNNCYTQITGPSVPTQTISDLPQMSLTGTAGPGYDQAILTTPVKAYTLTTQTSVLNLNGSWRTAEFNIFGDGTYNGNPNVANFNAGATLAVRTSVVNATTAPTCVAQTFTAEMNNLTLVRPCCQYGPSNGKSPAIVFTESSASGETSMCVNGTSVGDTHLTNINGLHYDFQASGDFLLVKADPDFVVQTRQASGRPPWQIVTLNKAVATQIGKARVAICVDPVRLIIDGRPEGLADGKSLSLPGGVGVSRNGNVYAVTGHNGETVLATLNNNSQNTWIDVSVNLGHPPVAKVQGLLGNDDGNAGENDIATSNGALLTKPVSFTDLYHSFADSWRVAPAESLLCEEPRVEASIPAMPFFSNDLDPREYARARAICTAVGVREGALLDDCTLDVAVLGDETAARVFARERAPRAVMRPVP